MKVAISQARTILDNEMTRTKLKVCKALSNHQSGRLQNYGNVGLRKGGTGGKGGGGLQCPAYVSGQAVSILQPRPRCNFENIFAKFVATYPIGYKKID